MPLSMKKIYFVIVFAVVPTLARPCDCNGDCGVNLGLADPAGFTGPMMSQWCGMITQEVNTLMFQEDPAIIVPQITVQYIQANIHVAPESALPNINQIMADPQARAAMERMKANYPLFGSLDLTAADIQEVYGPAIRAACTRTGVPEALMRDIIWTESKGHPLVYKAWGQYADLNTDCKNRYLPSDNIMASAMYLAHQQATFGCDWDTCYHQHYQDPNAARYASR